MWQKETFDPVTIDSELDMAQKIGMNCMRVFLHHVAWNIDKEGFKKRINEYLDIAASHHISTIFVFFDDCWNPTYAHGKQPAPKTGVHNSGWIQDPGAVLSQDSILIPELETYVKDILTSFKKDKRVIFWDLYNEAGNSGHGNKSLPLLKKVFSWARAINPAQPLTAGVWNAGLTEINNFLFQNSDIITYHNYNDSIMHQQAIDSLERYKRPLVCTEYMNRRDGSCYF